MINREEALHEFRVWAAEAKASGLPSDALLAAIHYGQLSALYQGKVPEDVERAFCEIDDMMTRLSSKLSRE